MWIQLSLAAGTLQAARNGLSRSLALEITPALNSWSRFAFCLPFAAAATLGLSAAVGWPRLPLAFFACCAATAITQLLGNVALVAAFRRSNFAQSIVLHKLEVAFTALVGVAVFDERPSATGWAGVALCTAGVVAMNLGRASGPAGLRRAFHLDGGAGLALTTAVLLVFASFMIKEAVGAYAAANPRVGAARFEPSMHTLFHTTWIETALLGAWLGVSKPAQFARVPRHFGRMLGIGLTGFLGSACWFWAYSLTLVAYVKAVGQIESLLAIGLALRVWGEREVLRQLPGIALLAAGIALVLLG